MHGNYSRETKQFTSIHLLAVATISATLTCCVLVFCFAGGLAVTLLGGYISWVPQDVPPASASPGASPPPIQTAPVHTPAARVTPNPTPASSTDWPSLHAVENAPVPQRDLYALTARLRHLSAPIPHTIPNQRGEYHVGDRRIFWIADSDAKTYFTATATLRVQTPHTYFWVDDAYNADDDALRRSAQHFEDKIYPTNRRIFGSEWSPGIDDDPHLHIFNGRVPGVGGYYSSADEYPRQINRYSNQNELFYINLDNAQPGTDYYDGILAHEFQHMIHWNVDRDEGTWVNEGLSELATQLNGLTIGNSIRLYQRTPDTQLNAWADAPRQAAAHYGASHLFFSYILGRWGEAAIQKIVARQENGFTGIQQALAPQAVTIGDLFADWVVANFLDRATPGDGRYDYPDTTVDPPRIDTEHQHYPVLRDSTVNQFAADYIEFSPDKPGTLHITFRGRQQVKLIPNDAHSGQYQWWANRGDQADMTLTRSFDLRTLSKATLDTWLWYNIEEEYDYAYIEVSTDGGTTWDILQGPHTTDKNPNASSFGWAYTGKSQANPSWDGQADKVAGATWIHELLDLSPYAGQEIELRFEYVTDDAINWPGFAVDDVRIPELNYFDDFEQDDSGWSAAGFVRIDNRLPQNYIVQAIVETNNPDNWRVERMALDARQQGELDVPAFGSDVDRVILVIAGLTRHTTELAGYQYEASLSP